MEEEKCPLFVYFGYSEDPKEINVLSNTEVSNKASQSVNLVDLPKLQQQCPDFQHIYAYLKDNVLPEDDKTRQVTVVEVRRFDLVDDILYHWYQRRVRKAVNDEVTHVRQIALPRVLREEALYAYHDSVAGGAHLGIEKVRTALVLKYYWPRMYQDIADYVRYVIDVSGQNVITILQIPP